MLSQIFTRRYPDVSRNPVDLDPASATADVNRKFRHEFRAPIQGPIHVERFCDLNTCETFNSAGINRRTTRTFGNYEILTRRNRGDGKPRCRAAFRQPKSAVADEAVKDWATRTGIGFASYECTIEQSWDVQYKRV
jgi:hypothetical protein